MGFKGETLSDLELFSRRFGRAELLIHGLDRISAEIHEELGRLSEFYYAKNPPLVEDREFFRIRRKLLERIEEIESIQEALELFTKTIKEGQQNVRKNMEAFVSALNAARSKIWRKQRR